MVLVYLPLVVAVLLLSVVLIAPHVPALDRRLTRIGYALFDRLVPERNPRRERVLRSAGDGTPYRIYATKTYLLATIASISGVILGVYVGALVIDLLNVDRLSTPVARNLFRPLPDWLTTFDAKYFALLLGAAVLVGGIAASTVYLIRWRIPAVRANTRRRQIDAGLPRTVAFVYALSRGGMAFPDVMRTLSYNRGVFGAAADEMRVAVRDIDLFGEDVVTAVRNLSHRTPSDQFQTFSENLTSVLQSGRNISEFLRSEYERYREEAEDQQREILDLLATTAEVYVTVVVAGMLFLVTILLVIGLTSGGMLPLIQVIAYVVLPATNVLFIAYLAEITQPLRATRDELNLGADGPPAGPSPLPTETSTSVTPDGGTPSDVADANRERLRAYRRFSGLLDTLGNPRDSLVRRPTLILYVTVPLAVGFVLLQLPAALEPDPTVVAIGGQTFETVGFDVRFFDDVLVQAAQFVLASFAVVHEVSRRRLERLEAAVPDLLERLASLNEAGVAVVSSFDRVRRSDVGALDDQVDYLWRDIRWGATVEEALDRFERRVRTPAVTRVVTLVTNAMRASNDIGPVLRIAAEQAHNDLRLKRQRRQEMLTYLVVIYLAFLVFVVVVGAIDFVLIPNLPTSDPTSGAGRSVSGPGVLSVTENADAYSLVFFHVGLIQAALSGLVGGQMGSGSIKGGVKHASIMLALAYLTFLLFQDVTAGAGTLTDLATVVTLLS